MTFTCPAGHTSTADDYCDVCGMPIDKNAVAQPSTPAAAPISPTPPKGLQSCPNCAVENSAEALFCEACGYDFTTGTMPRSGGPAAPDESTAGSSPAPHTNISASVPFEWVAELWIDPDWYEVQESPETLPSPGLPAVIALKNKSILIGRESKSRNIVPDIDCEPDTGTSRRQAQLTTDGSRWWVEDLESSNGTFVGPASGPLPQSPIPVGPKYELDTDDRIYIGAWTRLVIRAATDEEKTSLG